MSQQYIKNYTILEAAAELKLCRASIYKLINEGKLSTMKFGRRRIVSHSALLDYMKKSVA